jgi:hypothetical protein
MAGTRARPPAGGAPGSELTHHEAAEYIASMLDGLHSVAKSAEMPFLAYLIEVAREEADSQRAKRDGGAFPSP